MQHLDEGTVHAWLDGELSETESAAATQHVAECAQCAELVAEARGLIAGASRVVAALDAGPVGVIPRAQPANGAGFWRRLTRSPSRMAMAATILVAIGVTLTVRRSPRDNTFPRPAIVETPAVVSAPAAQTPNAAGAPASAAVAPGAPVGAQGSGGSHSVQQTGLCCGHAIRRRSSRRHRREKTVSDDRGWVGRQRGRRQEEGRGPATGPCRACGAAGGSGAGQGGTSRQNSGRGEAANPSRASAAGTGRPTARSRRPTAELAWGSTRFDQ